MLDAFAFVHLLRIFCRSGSLASILRLHRISPLFPLLSMSRRDPIIISKETTRYFLTDINPLSDKRQIHYLPRLAEIVESPPSGTTIQHLQLFIKVAHPPRTSILKRPIRTFTHHFFVTKLNFRNRVTFVRFYDPTSKLIFGKHFCNYIYIEEKAIAVPQLMFQPHQITQTTKCGKTTPVVIQILLHLLVELTLMIRATIETDSHITHTMIAFQLRTQIVHSSSARIVRIYCPIAFLLTELCLFHFGIGPIRPPPRFIFNFTGLWPIF